MKKLIFVLILALPGCAVVDYYRMAKWDNNEYMLVNDIRTEAQLGIEKCAVKDQVLPHVLYTYRKSVELNNYTAGIARNEETAKMAADLVAITRGLRDRYTSSDEISQKYCELKFNSINTNTGTIQKVLGDKPR